MSLSPLSIYLIVTWDSGMSTFSGGEALEEDFFYLWPFPQGFGCYLTRDAPVQSELMDIASACLDLPYVQASQTWLVLCGRGPMCPGLSYSDLAAECPLRPPPPCSLTIPQMGSGAQSASHMVMILAPDTGFSLSCSQTVTLKVFASAIHFPRQSKAIRCKESFSPCLAF